MLISLDRATVVVSDLDHAVRDYTRLLGRSPCARARYRDWDTEAATFQLANTSLVLLTPTPESSPSAPVARRLTKHGEGLYAMAFATDELDPTLRRLREAGLDVLEPMDGESTDSNTGAVRRWRSAVIPPSVSRGVVISIICEDLESSLPPPSPLEVEAGASAEALDHIVVHTQDVGAARHFYGEVLGLRLALDRRFDARGIHILFFRLGGTTIEVVARLRDDSEPAPTGPDRLGGLAWQVGNVAAIHARLGASGISVSEHRAGHKPGTRVCTVKDGTCGVPTLLIGPE